MWIQAPGALNDRLMLLGTRKNTVYLVKGERHMLIGGGTQWTVAELERQFREYRIDMDRVQYLVIGHTHYDHCGAVPYLKRRYPHLQILASQDAGTILGMDKALRNMRTFSHQVMHDLGKPLTFEGVSLEFDKIHLDRTLKDGDRVDLGPDLSFSVIEMPGHSRCCIALYEPREKWLFPSDSMALPVGENDRFASTASESFIRYLDSLKRLVPLDIRLCGWEHFGAMTGEDSRDIVRRVVLNTLEYKRRLVEHAGQTGDVEQTVRWAANGWLAATGFEFLPPDVMLHISRVMVKNALEEQVNEADYLEMRK